MALSGADWRMRVAACLAAIALLAAPSCEKEQPLSFVRAQKVQAGSAANSSKDTSLQEYQFSFYSGSWELWQQTILMIRHATTVTSTKDIAKLLPKRPVLSLYVPVSALCEVAQAFPSPEVKSVALAIDGNIDAAASECLVRINPHYLRVDDYQMTQPIVAALPMLTNLKGVAVRQSSGLQYLPEALTVLGVSYVGSTAPFKRFPKLEELHLSGSALSAEQLRQLPAVRTLDISETEMTDSDLSTVTMPELQSLNLGSTKVGEDDLSFLSRFPELRELILNDTKVTDGGRLALSQLSKLRKLQLYKAPVTNKTVQALTHLPELVALDLGSTKIDNNVALLIPKFTALKALSVSGTAVGDEVVVAAAKLPLHELDLGGTNITVNALPALKTMKTLRILNVEKTALERHQGQLKAALPNVALE